jgi:hypothetical protein
MSAAVDRPTPVAVARRLAELGASFKDFPGDVGNFERGQLEEAAAFLQREEPAVARALAAAEKGVAHAFRGRWVEDRPESWLCAAVAALLAAREGGAA